MSLKSASLGAKESMLQQWIWNDPTLLGEPIVLFGREVMTGYGKRIDLLGLDERQNVCIIELKRDKTPREVIAQALDYASWVAETDWEILDKVSFDNFGESIAQRFQDRFGIALNIEEQPEPRMIIVASQLDEASARIARFLTDRGIELNATFFSAFQDGAEQLLARSWLLNPSEAEQRVATAIKKKAASHAHSGFWFVNVGHTSDPDDRRSWNDNRKFGFMSAGGGMKYARLIKNVIEGEFVYAYLNQSGYVGFGEVISAAVPIDEFRLPDGSRLNPGQLEQPRLFDNAGDLENCEYLIGVKWLSTRNVGDGVKAPWHSVMTACALNQPATLEYLQGAFERSTDS